MLISKRIIGIILLVAWLLLFKNFNSEPVDYKKFVWFVWAGNFTSSLVIIIFSFLFFLTRGIYNRIEWKTLFSLAFSLLPLVFSHVVIGAFLSFFAQTDPMDKFGPNGFVNHFQWYDGLQLIHDYLPIFYPYFLTKLTYLDESKSAKAHGWMYSRDAFLVLVGAFVFPLLALALEKHELSYSLSQFSFVLISIFIFIPWHWFFSKDIHAKAFDKEAAITPEFKFPMVIPDQRFHGWGVFIFLFGLIFFIIGIFASYKLYLGGEFNILNLIFSLLFLIAFCGFGILAMLIGLNFQWGYRRITIQRDMVKGEERILLPFPVTLTWSKPLVQYKLPEKMIRVHNSKGSSHTEYQVVMKLKNPETPKPKSVSGWLIANKEIVLYKAYHEEDLEKYLKQSQEFFSFLESK